MAKYADKPPLDILLNVGDLVYMSTEHFLNASYLVSLLHVELHLFLSVALFPGFHITLTCCKTMRASTPYFMLAISILMLDQFLLALHHLFHSLMKLLMNLKFKIY